MVVDVDERSITASLNAIDVPTIGRMLEASVLMQLQAEKMREDAELRQLAAGELPAKPVAILPSAGGSASASAMQHLQAMLMQEIKRRCVTFLRRTLPLVEVPPLEGVLEEVQYQVSHLQLSRLEIDEDKVRPYSRRATRHCSYLLYPPR
jgi:hypothetical protein